MENTKVLRKVQFSPLQQTLKEVGFNLLARRKQSINQTIPRKISIIIY
jgi:hypothetical protein